MDNLMNNKAAMLGLSVLAFLIAAVLVITIFRMLFGGRLRMPGGRARQARLGIVDAFDLDRQRQLIIVRRDNTEHLIMIGGPNDVVIESEIIRAEVRDLRDARREPGLAADGRIPAPQAAGLDRGDALPRPADEPMLPMPLPPALDPRADGAQEPPARGPTFPLPPRRPAPAPAPERRPPAPPKLPDSVSRGDEVPALSGQPPAPAPAPPAPVPPPVRPQPPMAAPPVAPPIPPAAAPPASAPPAPPPVPGSRPAASPPRPPFLKPLPPRPPIRPLQRTTPQPGVPGAPTAPTLPQGAQPLAAPPRPGAPLPPTAPTPQSGDALESLEEEMAKLLGRGS